MIWILNYRINRQQVYIVFYLEFIKGAYSSAG